MVRGNGSSYRRLSGWAFCLAALLAAGTWLLPGCSEKASFTPEISDGLGTDSLFHSVTLMPILQTAASTEARAGAPYESGRLVVCNWRGRMARSFLRFSELPDSTVTVIKADLFLYATRIQSASGSDIYEVHALEETPNDRTVSWDTLEAYLGPQIASFSLTPDGPDTIRADSVVLDVTETVASWVSKETANTGIAIKRDNETGSESIVEFASREDGTTRTVSGDSASFFVRPVLRISYVDSSGADTSFVQALSTHDTFVDTLLVPLPDTLIACSNGFPTRTYLKFDIESAVPRQASVIMSELKLSVDLSASSFDSLSVIACALTEPFEGFTTEFGAVGTGIKLLTFHAIRETPSFSMNVTALVQPIVSQLVTNNGLLIKSTAESADLDFVVFASTAEGGGAPPRLEIRYTLPAPPGYERN